MLNLLPKPAARAVRRRYAARVAASLALALGAGVAAHGLALLPAIVEGKRAVAALAVRAEALRVSAETKEYGEASREAAALRRAARAASVAANPALSAAGDGIIRAVPSGISVASFAFERSSTSTVVAVIEGVAATREALLLFRSNLEEAPGVSSVDVPVSALAAEANSAFSVTVTVEQDAAN